MTNAVMKIEKFEYSGGIIDISVSFMPEKEVESPRIAIIFNAEPEDRRLPMTVEAKDGRLVASGRYDASQLFYGFTPKKIGISFVFSDGSDNGQQFESDLCVDVVKKSAISRFIKKPRGEKIKAIIGALLFLLSLPFRALPVKKRRISFFSNRTDVPTGNLKAVLDAVKDIPDTDIRVVCRKGGAKGTFLVLFRFLYLYMTSGVVFADDYYHLISYVKKKKQTRLIQLWHGCGAFKTFGFSRYHKDSALEIYSANHRQYDYAIVSSPDICDFYAEAFGISRKNVLALGSPRCDILSNEEYKAQKQNEFFAQFPALKGKKLLMFAPTFRGRGNGDCCYPMEKFNIDKVLEVLGEEWGIIIKLHPYLTEKPAISEKNKARVAECPNWDINDLLFSTDFLVTDYSSVIFEAALLEIPMAFLAFDLEEYIEKRDFYYSFKDFVPGPIVRSDVEAAEIAKTKSYDIQQVKSFAEKAFGTTAGKACANVRKLTEGLLEE